MNSVKNISNIPYHIACLVILMNILQFGFNGLGINFNMFIVEYFLILLLAFIKKFKIKNYYNLLLIFVVAIIFLFNMFFYSSSTLSFYIQEFIFFALPIIIVFMFEYDYKKLSDLFLKYCIFSLLLYLLNLVLNTSLLSDYMTFGYGGIFPTTYIAIYSIFHRKWKFLLFSILAGIIIFAYGSRGGLLVLGTGIFVSCLFYIKSTWKKVALITIALLVLIFNGNIMRFSVNTLTDLFGTDLYVIKQLNSMIEKEDFDEMLGGRYYIYQQGIEEIKDHTIFGMGVGAFQEKYSYFAHNIFIDVYSTFGIIFGTFYFIYLIIISKKVHKYTKDNIQVKIFFVFCLAIITKLLLSKTFIYDPYIWLMISLFLNIIFIFRKEKRDEGYDNSFYTNI